MASELSLLNDEGWEKVDSAFRQLDERKVKDCKEDIDNLLVFAGLFAAVITPLLIESYKGLQRDPTATIIALLQQISQQTESFTVNNGLVNSTILLVSDNGSTSTFVPARNAIRINTLWFTSLLLGLISASFGITVKQWLREFLTGDHSTPQLRLRIRQSRYDSMLHWGVFEIASLVLPFLLQTSLVLFFAGLCYFTTDIYSSINHATLTLVAAWALLFLASIIAPAFDPTCPYKTPYLKITELFKFLRSLFQRM
ncbi:hypothetical protein BDY19DRAFT_897359 [Irpex rosettiformis]|uniref:Uncharacterized protein n=1 Tax=Irpex rosettiformis TaxID=378272 RepID=A0ACB8TSU4_9APHY|nr:hypothetical protein BDY19DRAFT_897359 [Irpex rosettiformis]